MATSKAATKHDSETGQEKFSQAYRLAGEAAADMVNGVKGQAKVALDENKERAADMAGRAESLIKERPLLSIGCAFVAGWAVSKILK